MRPEQQRNRTAKDPCRRPAYATAWTISFWARLLTILRVSSLVVVVYCAGGELGCFWGTPQNATFSPVEESRICEAPALHGSKALHGNPHRRSGGVAPATPAQDVGFKEANLSQVKTCASTMSLRICLFSYNMSIVSQV